MANFREEYKRNPEFFSDDIGPIRAVSSLESAHLTQKRPSSSGGSRDMEVYGKLGTTDGVQPLGLKGQVRGLHLEFRKLGMSLPQENGKNNGRDISRKCMTKTGHKDCLGCKCPCHAEGRKRSMMFRGGTFE